MAAVVRILTLYLLNLMLTVGFLPEALTEAFRNDSEAMRTLENLIAVALTLLITLLTTWVKGYLWSRKVTIDRAAFEAKDQTQSNVPAPKEGAEGDSTK